MLCLEGVDEDVCVRVWQGDPGAGVDAFFHALYTRHGDARPLALLGSASSDVTESLAKVAPYWNMLQVKVDIAPLILEFKDLQMSKNWCQLD
ncbi:Uncharacterized protein GBIM_02195 [Gryllus bimaculatus]|nr:Uncharacterized protein GBIM_02195 [Gryllus bimaculatus]